MTSLLLVIIYMAFISLGLPDSMLGSAWPAAYGEMGVPISYAGIVSMIIAGGTIISSLFSDRFIRRFGTGIVTMFCVMLTAAALFGFACSHSFLSLCLWAVPYGMGGGSVDAALNNYVAGHFKSRHMSWLHCFWGIGATAGPYIMGWCLTNGFTWNKGYQTVGSLQVGLVVIMLLSLPLWKMNKTQTQEDVKIQTLSIRETMGLPGAKAVMTAFFCYCALEATTGLWASSFMVLNRGISAEVAAKWASLFYLGITGGRFICGFITEKLGDDQMVHIGQMISGCGVLLLILQLFSQPIQQMFPTTLTNAVTIIGLVLIGLGCAPIYPSMLHATPATFGAEYSQSIMGMQMAFAYVGSTVMPTVFGFLADHIDIALYPFYLMIFIIVMAIMTKRVKYIVKK